ncbi:MAG: HD domain-containing protein [Pseudomonadota bacterium]
MTTERMGQEQSASAQETIPLSEMRAFFAALDFAAERHAGQKRKGAAAEPYVNHLIDVARILSTTPIGSDLNLLMAAVLHDTVEDQDVQPAEIEALFGSDVRELVDAATDDKGILKDERKRRQVVNAPGKSPRASLLKTADKISNVRAIASSPPAGWGVERMSAYIDWGTAVVDGLLDPPKTFSKSSEKAARDMLRAAFDAAAADARAAVAKLAGGTS